MVKVGLTGGAASGKTTVCRLFREKGVAVSIADDLARDAVAPGSPGFEAVVDWFGDGVVGADGCLDRPALRRKLISDPEARRVLESIVQPEVIRLMERFLEQEAATGASMAVCEVPLLFELNLESMFDITLHVGVDRSTQCARLMARDGVSEAEAMRLLALQLSDGVKRERADLVIENLQGLSELKGAFYKVFEKIVKKCSAHL
ncbi:dephospho-CoA kinase [Desulfoluna spongiiphila]|uniref:dephospho-CoA kinase n=1 Tax=Desulfoluna spongiiphila TaxID=419481 RepID=UPI001256FBDE|nr:dephospho-CoA kinase [Desulfoluna spongiiphila]VVS90493.1 dephospho-coa kinase [Desulfoluna spongiiphila]